MRGRGGGVVQHQGDNRGKVGNEAMRSGRENEGGGGREEKRKADRKKKLRKIFFYRK